MMMTSHYDTTITAPTEGLERAMHVLVIEDDAETASYIAKGLGRVGLLGRHFATDGKDGLLMAVGEEYDIAVVDRMLPGLDGLSLVETLRRTGKHTPILFLSALGGVDDRVKGLRSRRRRLPGQAFRLLRASGPHRGPVAAARQRGGRDPVARGRPGDGRAWRASCAGPASRSCSSRASSSCSSTCCATPARWSPGPCCWSTSGATISTRRPTSSTSTSAGFAKRSIAAMISPCYIPSAVQGTCCVRPT